MPAKSDDVRQSSENRKETDSGQVVERLVELLTIVLLEVTGQKLVICPSRRSSWAAHQTAGSRIGAGRVRVIRKIIKWIICSLLLPGGTLLQELGKVWVQ